MGQAKQRGSLEDCITIEEAKRRLRLPDNAEFLGYVIHLYDQDEFVGKIEENDIVINRVYVKIPDLAQIFDSVEEAIHEALKIDKYRLLVCLLFEVDNQHLIHDVWANF